VALERGYVVGRERVSGRQVSVGGRGKRGGKWSTRRGGGAVSCLVWGGVQVNEEVP
jgi:hypothetical protein